MGNTLVSLRYKKRSDRNHSFFVAGERLECRAEHHTFVCNRIILRSKASLCQREVWRECKYGRERDLNVAQTTARHQRRGSAVKLSLVREKPRS